MPCHAMPYHAMPCHAMPYLTIPYHAIPYHIMPHYIVYYTLLASQQAPLRPAIGSTKQVQPSATSFRLKLPRGAPLQPAAFGIRGPGHVHGSNRRPEAGLRPKSIPEPKAALSGIRSPVCHPEVLRTILKPLKAQTREASRTLDTAGIPQDLNRTWRTQEHGISGQRQGPWIG